MDHFDNFCRQHNFEIPKYKILLSKKRQHQFALVIPVVNEGKRIQNQLRQLTEHSYPLDIIVADGGSTDQSIDSDFIETTNVNTVIQKLGSGKLSAQLRVAYAFCLYSGYTGIVTIDGNGKDGLEAIPLFLDKLEQGADYVQGSRYLKGGKSINTPILRHIGNRMIQAPLLSLAARKWYTDTTNGFRGYSTRFLNHKKVKPFRSIFSDYQLLFYLTKTAGRLNFSVVQVPVSRTYPREGQVPTKIAGISGLMSILRQTIEVAIGRFDV